ncbi:MAG: hypothetical protein IPI27_11400 [Betaproteobacteria bacterium]|nr:hypothetical protein [Betaproteobacteria bacterium]
MIPRRAVDLGAVEIRIAALVRSRVQAAAHAQSHAGGGLGVGQRQLHLQDRGERIVGPREGRVDTVAGGLHHGAPVLLDRRSRQGVVAGERDPHARGRLLPQARAALDVGEEERYRGRLANQGDASGREALWRAARRSPGIATAAGQATRFRVIRSSASA